MATPTEPVALLMKLEVDAWGPERAGELAALCELALPGERLTADELLACCWDDPGVVLAPPGGAAAAAACVRDRSEGRVGYVKLLAVEPAAQGLGHGRALLDAVHDWAWCEGAAEVWAGGAAPFYLWPGLDVRMTRALCLFEAVGYTASGATLNMSCPTTHRARPPAGVEIRRVIDDPDAEAVLDLVSKEWPAGLPQTDRAVEHGSCLGAFEAGYAVGFACHSVNRAAWVGPIGTRADRRRRGIGAALLGEACKDLMVAGYPDAELDAVGPIGFYAKAAGAAVSRVFRSLVLPRP